MIITLYYSDVTDNIYLDQEEAIAHDKNATKRKKRIEGEAQLISEFESVRQEYIKQTQQLRNKYGTKMDDLLEKIRIARQ